MNEKLHHFHLVILIYMIQSGVVIFSLPGLLAEFFGTNGWVMLFVCSFIVMINIFLISLVYRFGNGESIFVILEKTIPKVFLFPFYFGLALVWALLGCAVGKQYVLIFQMISFPTTNPMIFKLMLSILAFLLLIKGIYNISKAATIFFFLTVWMVALQLFHLPDIELARYTTFFLKNGADPITGLFDTYSAFLGYELGILLFPFVTKASKLIRSIFYGNLIVTFVYVTLAVVCFGFYSYQQLANMLFPILDLLSYIQLPFIERIENLLFAIFFLKTLITTVLYYWAAQQVMKRVFRRVDESVTGFVIVTIAYFIAFFPRVLSDVNDWLKRLAYVEMGVAFGLPVLVLFVLFIQRIRSAAHEKL